MNKQILNKEIPQYKYNSIVKLKEMYQSEEINLDILVKETQLFFEQTKKYNYIINTNEEALNNLIKQQIMKLTKISENYDWNELYNKYPLWGVPVLIKDNIDVNTLATTSGSSKFLTNIAQTNALGVQKLIDFGAIIVGKTNLSEFSGMCAQHGISELGGKTLNPINEEFDTSGSSSGSSVGAKLGFPLCIGSETFGSIIAPATCCGVYGWKPEQSLLTDFNGIPISHHYDTVGAITSNIDNLNYFANCLGVTQKKAKKVLIDNGLTFKLLGLNFWQSDDKEITNIFEKLKDCFEKNGYEVTIKKSSFLKTLPLTKQINNNIYTDLEIDFNKWNKEQRFDFESYMEYAKNLPEHFDVSKNNSKLTPEKKNKVLAKEKNYYKKNYENYDIVVGLPMCATFVSSLQQNPAITIPLGYSNDKVSAIGICAKNSDFLLEITKLISKSI